MFLSASMLGGLPTKPRTIFDSSWAKEEDALGMNGIERVKISSSSSFVLASSAFVAVRRYVSSTVAFWLSMRAGSSKLRSAIALI